MVRPGVLVHGGAGDLSEDRIAGHVAGCLRAARAGALVLRAGGSAVDAVERAVEVLEDDPRFNAGTGACLTRDGTVELDAAIMEGASLAAGAVCAMPPFRNPVAIARAVMLSAKHVMYAADGARAFAEARGFAPLPAEALITESARERWRAVREGRASAGWAGGTVGAVAWDGAHVAAATSTGGMVNKEPGRVGDSPLIGAGTLADDALGAASATGVGEGIIRISLARLACERLRGGTAPSRAAESALAELTRRIGTTAGVILISPTGEPGWAHSTKTMTRAYVSIDGEEVSGA